MINKMLVKWLAETNMSEVSLVGGKNASLGEMINQLNILNIKIPNGFVVTSQAYDLFLKFNKLDNNINNILNEIDVDNLDNLKTKAHQIREMINKGNIPEQLIHEIKNYYDLLCVEYHNENVDVAVRSSSTAEDMPDASFAGQQDTYLNISGIENVITHIKYCFASLYTDRAICYRKSTGYTNAKLSVCIQKMVRSDLACSGVAFSLDPDTGFPDIVCINASYGLGEMVVSGKVKPDEFIYFKPTQSCIDKKMGEKSEIMVYDEHTHTHITHVSKELRNKFCLTDSQIITLGKWVSSIENYYSEKYQKWCPVDVEWAIDGQTNTLFIVQARPETIHSNRGIQQEIITYQLCCNQTLQQLATGIAVGDKIASGKIIYISNMEAPECQLFKNGDILLTEYTDPSFEPLMKIASAIITERGGRTSHAAIVSRELGKIAVVGVNNAVELLNGNVTVCCHLGDVGIIYNGKLEYKEIKTPINLNNQLQINTKLMCNIGNPESVFKYYNLPVKGVGLARLEFIIANYIRVHPNALLNYNNLDDNLKQQIDKLTIGYNTSIDYYINKLANGIARIACTFYPEPVIVRFSDFKTNEYKDLLGGYLYEPVEENPMLGFRGCSRYYSEEFKKAFGLECEAIKLVRNIYGLNNVVVMLPFCRTIKECQLTLSTMEEFGLRRGDNGLQVYLMCEIPSNAILADEFCQYVDGFSIGSNDLTQLTLGLDRDGGKLTTIGNETDMAVKYLIKRAIKACKRHDKKIGICGQGPSDIPEFADFLIDCGIDTISLIPDTIWTTYMRYSKKI